MDDIDDNVTVDMTEDSMDQTHLTYMYADDEDVTYPFGYGRLTQNLLTPV